jgi:hypothetical protein
MKTWVVKITSVLLLFGFLFTGCAEHRHYYRDHDDLYHHRDRDDRRDNDHHRGNNHHDNDHHDDNDHH